MSNNTAGTGASHRTPGRPKADDPGTTVCVWVPQSQRDALLESAADQAITLSAFLEIEPPEREPDMPAFMPLLPHAPKDRVLVSQVWSVLGLHSPAQRDERAVIRLEAVMQVLGYEKKQMRGLGEPEDGDDKKSAKRWCRIVVEPPKDSEG